MVGVRPGGNLVKSIHQDEVGHIEQAMDPPLPAVHSLPIFGADGMSEESQRLASIATIQKGPPRSVVCLLCLLCILCSVFLDCLNIKQRQTSKTFHLAPKSSCPTAPRLISEPCFDSDFFARRIWRQSRRKSASLCKLAPGPSFGRAPSSSPQTEGDPTLDPPCSPTLMTIHSMTYSINTSTWIRQVPTVTKTFHSPAILTRCSPWTPYPATVASTLPPSPPQSNPSSHPSSNSRPGERTCGRCRRILLPLQVPPPLHFRTRSRPRRSPI